MSLSINDTLSKLAIRTVFKESGTVGYGVVNVLINRFINSFAFTTKLSDSQLEILTVDTLEKFEYESLEDVILFFKMARTGKFGATKKAPDSNLIFGSWYPQYLDLKADAIERENATKKGTFTKLNLDGSLFVEKYIKDQARKIKIQKIIEEVDEMTKYMDRQMLEDTITSFKKDKTLNFYTKLLIKKRRIIN